MASFLALRRNSQFSGVLFRKCLSFALRLAANRALPMRRHVRHVFLAPTHFFHRCHFVQYVVHKCIPHVNLIVDVIRQLSNMPWGRGQKLFVMFVCKECLSCLCCVKAVSVEYKAPCILLSSNLHAHLPLYSF